jgi:hypothetical protein
MFVGNAAAMELGKITNSGNVRINTTERVRIYGIHFQSCRCRKVVC